ncbi:hypothetical protein Phou_083100 [Phytohabitans houttuyneae]|uniref:Uncharacterized protein n=1 Tax=Phytohabitans houttuyneae TaxID=1076126 RepID=A0A6V8KL23_9ACTN|nr:hypothetical protein Phou_083100 [Phytohabitans houttuyneae]
MGSAWVSQLVAGSSYHRVSGSPAAVGPAGAAEVGVSRPRRGDRHEGGGDAGGQQAPQPMVGKDGHETTPVIRCFVGDLTDDIDTKQELIAIPPMYQCDRGCG